MSKLKAATDRGPEAGWGAAGSGAGLAGGGPCPLTPRSPPAGADIQRNVGCLDYLHLQGEVGLAQEDALAHDAAVLHTDLQVRAVQPPVGVLHPAGMEKYLVVVKNI